MHNPTVCIFFFLHLGCAKLFCFSGDKVVLVRVFNEQVRFVHTYFIMLKSSKNYRQKQSMWYEGNVIFKSFDYTFGFC